MGLALALDLAAGFAAGLATGLEADLAAGLAADLAAGLAPDFAEYGGALLADLLAALKAGLPADFAGALRVGFKASEPIGPTGTASRRVGVRPALTLAFFLATGLRTGSAGLGAPSLRRIGLSPQISSRL